MEIVLGSLLSNHLIYFTLNGLRSIEPGFSEFMLCLHRWVRSSRWNVSQGKQQKPVKKSLLGRWLLSWDRQRSHCLAGIEEVRDQREVLQRGVVDDAGVLHLKPGGEKKKEGQGQESPQFGAFSRLQRFNPFSPVSRGYDIVYRGWRGVSGGAEGLSQTVGPCLGKYEPVSDVELRQQAVVHYLIQVIPWGSPQAAAEHGSIQGRGLREEMACLKFLKHSKLEMTAL